MGKSNTKPRAKPRSPFSVLTLTYDRSTQQIGATAHNISQLEALRLMQRHSLQLLDNLKESPAPSEDAQGASPDGN